jgi:cytochrome b pre-mRNA-processing protein 3
MLEWLRARSRIRRKAGELYGAVVTAARTPEYYSVFRVPDTPEGRFEMVALMLFLVLERVRRVPGGGKALAQGAIEAFVADMDDCLREMGVGDLTVPKKVRRAAAAFYDRAGQYRDALQRGETTALAEVLGRTVFQQAAGGRPAALADLVQRQVMALASAPDATDFKIETDRILRADFGGPVADRQTALRDMAT